MKKRSSGALLITLFILGLLFLNFPLLSLFSQPATALGLPLLYFYLIACWAVIIAVLALAAEFLT